MKIKIPWILAGALLNELFKSARGGIDKEEAEKLIANLAEIIVVITKQLN